MTEFLRAAFYAKNLPRTERIARVIAALGVALGATYLGNSAWLSWLGLASAVTLVATGLFGFCPACYLAGRKLDHTRTQ